MRSINETLEFCDEFESAIVNSLQKKQWDRAKEYLDELNDLDNLKFVSRNMILDLKRLARRCEELSQSEKKLRDTEISKCNEKGGSFFASLHEIDNKGKVDFAMSFARSWQPILSAMGDVRDSEYFDEIDLLNSLYTQFKSLMTEWCEFILKEMSKCNNNDSAIPIEHVDVIQSSFQVGMLANSSIGVSHTTIQNLYRNSKAFSERSILSFQASMNIIRKQLKRKLQQHDSTDYDIQPKKVTTTDRSNEKIYEAIKHGFTKIALSKTLNTYQNVLETTELGVLLQLMSRLSRSETRLNLGTISEQDHSQEINKVNAALLSILQRLDS